MDIRKVIAFVRQRCLFNLIRVGSRNNYRDDQLIDQPFVMDVGTGNVHGQGRTSSIHQQVNFATALATVNRTLARVGTPQWCGTRFAVNGLPSPLDTSSAFIKTHKLPHQALKNTALLPLLETGVKCATAYSKPVLAHSFP